MEPLAATLRPKSLQGFIGQKHLVDPGKPIRLAIEKKHIFSFILWGPPGVGKTTLARIYAQALDAQYFELSAVSTGKDDIKKIIEIKEPLVLEQKPKVLFLDEATSALDQASQSLIFKNLKSLNITLVVIAHRLSTILDADRIYRLEDGRNKTITKL